eukprot:6079756-Pleurochrysis_carterae.AAC.1
MWELLDSRATGYREATTEERDAALRTLYPSLAAAPSSTIEQEVPSTSVAPMRQELRGNALRQALSSAARTSDMNVVSHP